ncbi:MAG: ATP-binding protein [Candidatus Azobacteroides pseudotrichonymphae]|uniref:DnaC n=1 Tax=Candidatus Improbicoccus pseudotrichonymphae TaxID=3033792 RepID=A0AA48HXV5_9FIRM|nr:MAG: putative DnaC [Candidatus Improbicoccus pseudotrichonymphae]GMO34032.1 MAG: ATP-binding protein [Candidatus Azobacteroides pseudotrichonymphae]
MKKEKSTEVENLGVPNIRNSTMEQKDEQNSNKKPEKVTRYCKNCGEPNEKEVFEKMFDNWYTVHSFCKCEKEAEFKRKMNVLIKNSLLGERYKNVSFENSKTSINPTFDIAFNRCKKYCEIYKTVKENGIGIYLFGPSGVGKTHITACMANELIKNLVSVLFTNLFEISKAVKSTFNKDSKQTEQKLIDQFSNIEFLFMDDLGAEIFTRNQEDNWLQSLLFDLINKRYNAKLPTIFSSNYSLNELINQRQLSKRTISRITEMTKGAVMKIEGKDLRNSINSENLGF